MIFSPVHPTHLNPMQKFETWKFIYFLDRKLIFDSGGVHMFYSSRFSAQLIGNKCHSPTHTREREKSREREREKKREREKSRERDRGRYTWWKWQDTAMTRVSERWNAATTTTTTTTKTMNVLAREDNGELKQMTQTVWPDWTIFESSWQQIFLQK